jgi:hypothetical protein
MLQRFYIRPNGQVLSELHFEKILNDAQEFARREPHAMSHPLFYEIVWMLQQYQPGHPLLTRVGGYVPPPSTTTPGVLQRLGLPAQQYQPQPHAMAPNMLPPGMIPHGHPAARQAGQSMSIDPGLANASTTVNLPIMGWQSPMQPRKKKRKLPSTAFEMPSPKRLVIDLTDDNKQDPTKATHQPHTMQAAPSYVYKNLTSNAIPDVLISDDRDDALRNYALTHGVHMSNVELDDSTRRNTMNWIQQRKDDRAANCLLDPSAIQLQRMACANAQQAPATYVAEPTVAAAYRKVRSGQFDFTFEAIRVPETTLPTTEAYMEERCTLDADGKLRAPEDKEPGEERAELLWAIQQS